MAGLCWVAVMLAFFLSAQTSLAAVDQNRLATIVDGILREYKTDRMFSLAVSIPENQNQDVDQILQQVFTSDPGDSVKNKINTGDVYKGSRVVAATVLKRNRGADHAESRVVDLLDHLYKNRNANDMLLFYVYASPCVEKCSSDTHRQNILRRITQIRQWNSYAVVFTKIFIPGNYEPNTDQERREALERLGGSIGLDNIFRCDRQGRNGLMECSSCSSDDQVENYCFSLKQDNRNGNGGRGGRGRGGSQGGRGSRGRGGSRGGRGSRGRGGSRGGRGSRGRGGSRGGTGGWGRGGSRGGTGGWGRGGSRGGTGGWGRGGSRGGTGGWGRGGSRGGTGGWGRGGSRGGTGGWGRGGSRGGRGGRG